MHVLCVSPYFHPKVGGMERYAYEICRRLSRDNEVTVVTSGSGFNEEKIDGMRVVRVPVDVRVSNTPVSFRLPLRIRRYVEMCDVVYAHTPVPFYADVSILVSELLFKKPSLLVYHSGEVRGDGFVGVLAKAYRIWEEGMVRRATAVVGVSEFVKERINADEVVTPGVDSDIYRPGSKDRAKKILFVGQLRRGHEWKGLDLLLKSISNIVEVLDTKISLTVVGGGDLREHYRRMAEKLKLDVEFKGWVDERELIGEYSSSRLLVLPSKSDQESFGMVLLEANACGTGVVGTKVGGIPNYIRDGKNGYLSDPNENSLSEKILIGLDNYKKIGRVGLRISRKYSWDRSARKTEKLLESI